MIQRHEFHYEKSIKMYKDSMILNASQVIFKN